MRTAKSTAGLVAQLLLRFDGGSGRAGRCGERGAEAVATGGEHVAAVTFDALRTIASWIRTAAAMSAGASSHRRVESSMSVNRNVTVPDGAAAATWAP